MVRLYTDELNIGYRERLIVKNLSVEIPDKKMTIIGYYYLQTSLDVMQLTPTVFQQALWSP